MDFTTRPPWTHLRRRIHPLARLASRLASRLAWGGLILLALLAGCAPIGGRGQADVQETGRILEAGHPLGQSFTATFAGLNGLRVYLAPLQDGEGQLVLSLYNSPNKETRLSQARLALAQVSRPNFYAMGFSDQPGSFLSGYYLELELQGGGQLRVGSAAANTYLDGSLYQDGQPQPAQLAFLPLYRLRPALLGLAREALAWTGWLLAAAYLLLPGFALLRLLAGQWFAGLPFGSRLSLAAACGLGLYPTLFLLAWLAHLPLGPALTFAPGGLSLAYLLFQALAKNGWRRPARLPSFKELLPAAPDAAFLASGLVLVFTRLWAVRTLPLPLFGDSVHHTLITRLIIQNNGLFDSWQPWAEMQSLSYHFGFHVLAAALHWLTGLETAQAVLVWGQLLNVLAVLALYPLAVKVSRGSRWAGVFAVLFAGCLTNMPMFYTNWGRYTQLAGQVLLPGALLLLWEQIETPPQPRQAGPGFPPAWKLALLTGLTWGGLALTHYRVLIFAMLAVPGLILPPLTTRHSPLTARLYFARYRWLAAAGLLAGLIFLPWFLHIRASGIMRNLVQQVTTPVQALAQSSLEYNATGPLEQYLPILAWLAMTLSAAWGFWRQRKEVLTVCAWGLLVLLAANPGWFRLPGSGALSNFAVFIAAYTFAAALIGAAAAWIVEWAAARRRRLAGALALLLVLALSGLGGVQRLRDLHPESFALATWADLRAMDWIRANTPTDARFLVNSFFAYGGSVIVGSDGGWWLPQAALRQTMLPPMLYATETGPDPKYATRVNQLRRLIEEKGYTAPETTQALRERGIRYAYIGQRGGLVNFNGPVLLDPAQLQASGLWKVVYHQDQVWVLELP